MATYLGAIGVPHYTKEGQLYTGATHKDASGRLMTGKFHNANSQFLFHTRNGIEGIKGNLEEELISKRNKLYIQALKLFPNSPNQIKVRKEIEKLNKLINKK